MNNAKQQAKKLSTATHVVKHFEKIKLGRNQYEVKITRTMNYALCLLKVYASAADPSEMIGENVLGWLMPLAARVHGIKRPYQV